MAGFYGNINNINRSQFHFDKIYTSRAEMEDNINKDDVYVGRFVLIEYGNSNDFNENIKIDTDKYNKSFDSTVWQKVNKDGIDSYVMIAELNNIPPEIQVWTELLNPENSGIVRLENGKIELINYIALDDEKAQSLVAEAFSCPAPGRAAVW